MRIGVLASGGGSNLQSIIDACSDGRLSGEVGLVISNNSGSGALERARGANIPALHLSSKTHPADLDAAILDALRSHGIDYIALAGYMKKLQAKTLLAYQNRVFNIHPALLPRFGGEGMYGMEVHRAVIAAGAASSGPTVHLVNAEYDQGSILSQEEVAVLEGDDPESLQKRVLEVEHRIYPATLEAVSKGLIAIHGGSADLVVRPLSLLSDFDKAVKVVRSAFRTPAERFRITEDNCPSHPSFVVREKLCKVREDGGTFFGAYEKAEMAGCVAIEPSGDEEGTWYVEKLAVPPENRETGLGSLLLDHAVRGASVFGGRRISVALIDEDESLKNWYRKRGFTEAETRTFLHLPFTVCFMARNL